MNRKITISGFQFFCIIYMFEVGTASLIGLAGGAKQDAWISLLIALCMGCLLYLVYYKLFQFYPEMQLTQYVQQILGKIAGTILAMFYILYFLYIAARDLRDFEELLVSTLFNGSSNILIGIIMLFLVMYALFKGFETFARVNEVIFIFVMIIFIILIGFEIISKSYNLNNLRPVLENGWKPIFKEAFPLTVTFPFGEMITFTMILPHLKKQETALKVGLPALLFSGFMLVIITIKNLLILGAAVLERTNYPMLTAVSYINIANFVQRLDPFIVILMVFGGFIKISVFFYCAMSGAADIFGVKKSDNLVYPMSVIILLSSIWMAPNFLEHYKEGLDIVPYYLHIPFQILIPIGLLIISFVQRKQTESSIKIE